MKISTELTDAAVLKELGARVAGARLGRNLTQATLAEEAGVSKSTVERLESGAVAAHLSGFLRVCRVLGLLGNFENLIPEAATSPMEQLKKQRGKRQRATGKRVSTGKPGKWTWGDES